MKKVIYLLVICSIMLASCGKVIKSATKFIKSSKGFFRTEKSFAKKNSHSFSKPQDEGNYYYNINIQEKSESDDSQW